MTDQNYRDAVEKAKKDYAALQPSTDDPAFLLGDPLKVIALLEHQYHAEALLHGSALYEAIEKKALALLEEAYIYRTALLAITGCFGPQDIQAVARKALQAGAKANPSKTVVMVEPEPPEVT